VLPLTLFAASNNAQNFDDENRIDKWDRNDDERQRLCFVAKSKLADLPIVILTGLDDDQTALDALEHGAQDYLVKGNTNSRELQRTLRHAVQRQQILNENRRLVSQLQIAARSDALTGVLNRHAMTEEFELHWSGSNLYGCPLSCVILDVDKFKAINDQFGHLAGDEVFDQADQALMIAKKSGRDHVRAFSDAATAASSVSPIPGAVCPAKANPTSGMPETMKPGIASSLSICAMS
jgi:PleD family two-component response regulator